MRCPECTAEGWNHIAYIHHFRFDETRHEIVTWEEAKPHVEVFYYHCTNGHEWEVNREEAV